MSEPTQHDFEQLATGVDVDAAFAVFERRRRRRAATRRGAVAGSTVVVVLAAVVAVLATRGEPEQPFAISPDGEAADIGACVPTVGGEPFAFADLFEETLAWVEAEGIHGEPFPEYDDYVRDAYRRIGADEGLLSAVSHQRVEFIDPVVRRPGLVESGAYEEPGRTVVASTTVVESVGPDDVVIAALSQSSGGLGGDPSATDYVETLVVIHPDGTVEFAGSCARQRYTEPLQRATTAMAAAGAVGVDSEAETLRRMIDDPTFARTALAAAGERGQLDGMLVALPPLEPAYSYTATSSAGSILELTVEGGSVCVLIDYPGDPASGSACRSAGRRAPIVASSQRSPTDPTEVFGAVDGDVTSVVAVASDGTSFEGEVLRSADGEVALFSIVVPSGTPLVEVQFLDSNGSVIDTIIGVGLVRR